MEQKTESGDSWKLYIISHTHWDREWYYSFEHFRQLLLDVIDHTLKTLERDARFVAFHLDGQTAPVLDYLEIKPRERARLARLVRAGRLLIGPVYVQNDEFLASGEATVRNFLVGQLDCEQLKVKPLKVGYLLDQFGHCSQMPQILREYGIRWAVVGRGLRNGVAGKNVFFWQAADGSRCLTYFLSQWYNNLQRMPEELNTAIRLLNLIIEHHKNRVVGNSILLMNGVDHLDIQAELPDLIEQIRAAGFPHQLIHCTMGKFFAEVEQELKRNKLRLVHYGELRDADDDSLLSGTLSTRIYLKQQNAYLTRRLVHYLEPICVLADLLKVQDYPVESLQYVWRVLLQNQPHDSITGCGIDETHFQMIARFHRVNDVVRFWVQRVGEALAYQVAVDQNRYSDTEQILLVWNPTVVRRQEITEITVLFPLWEGNETAGEPIIYPLEESATPLCSRILGVDVALRRYTHPLRLPIEVPMREYRMLVEFPELPPLGYKAFVIKRKADFTLPVVKNKESEARSEWMENEFLKVKVNNDGTFMLEDKRTGNKFEQLHFLEDSGDAGHEYIFQPPENNEIITSQNQTAQITKLENTELRQVIKIKTILNIPAGINFEEQRRSTAKIPHEIETKLILRKDFPAIEIQTRINNQAENHRLRAGFPLRLEAARVFAESPFDVVERTRQSGESAGCAGEPNSGFVMVRSAEKGMALLCDGLPEYYYDVEQQTLYLTLLRAVGDLSHERQQYKGKLREFKTPEAQCRGELVFRYALFPLGDDTTPAEVKRICDQFLNPPEFFCSFLKPKQVYARDRDSGQLNAFFIPPLEKMFPYPRRLPAELSLLRCDNPAIVFSAFKQAERTREAYICRIYNISGENQVAELEFCKPLSEVYLANLNEQRRRKLPFLKNKVVISLPPHKIRTLYLKFIT